MHPKEYPPAVVARFWLKVDATDLSGCWEWKATRRGGYGQFSVTAGGSIGAHRIAYQLLVGEIPEGMILDHLCRNTGCVNPRHLEPVSNGENVLRGVGPSAENARKTHCIRGHPFDDRNTYVDPKGQRQCRACRRHWDSVHKTRKKNAALRRAQ